MKVFLLGFSKDVHDDANPFCYTLEDEIVSNHPDVMFCNDVNVFWSDDIFSFDVVHIMWPQVLLCGSRFSLNDVEYRFLSLKERKIKVIATCHNLKPHVLSSQAEKNIYDLVYGHSDYIVHLGSYSCNLFRTKFPNVKNVIIPHHVYDNIYKYEINRNDALKLLGLKADRRYIVCLGDFRKSDERKLVVKLAKAIVDKNLYILAPLFIKRSKNILTPLHYLKSNLVYLFMRVFHKRIIFNGSRVPNNLINAYYAVSDIAFVQRTEILNSGNVPLGLFMGKVVIGPNVGNVGFLLQETGNVVFNPNNISSLTDALAEAELKCSLGVGNLNRVFAIKNYSTSICSEKYYQLYQKMSL